MKQWGRLNDKLWKVKIIFGLSQGAKRSECSLISQVKLEKCSNILLKATNVGIIFWNFATFYKSLDSQQTAEDYGF